MELRRYATLLAAGTAGSTPLVLPLNVAGSADLAINTTWTPAGSVPPSTDGDVQISIDEAAFVNVTNKPTYVNGRWRLVLTALELTGKSILVRVVDSATKAVDDALVEVQTFGHASAFYPGDYVDTATLGTPISATQAARLNADIDSRAAAADYTTARAAKIDNLDAAITTRLPTASYVTPPTVGAVADAVWDEALAGHTTAGTTGRALQIARAQGKGKWVISGDTLTLYDVDNTTVIATFTLAPSGGPFTSRQAVAE